MHFESKSEHIFDNNSKIVGIILLVERTVGINRDKILCLNVMLGYPLNSKPSKGFESKLKKAHIMVGKTICNICDFFKDDSLCTNSCDVW